MSDDNKQSEESDRIKTSFRWVSLIATTIVMFATVVQFISLGSELGGVEDSRKRYIKELSQRVDSLEMAFDNLERGSTDSLRPLRDSLHQVPERVSKTKRDSLFQRVSQIKSKVSRIESIIADDPLKALQLPILKKEIESTKNNLNSKIDVLEDQVRRVYSLGQWLIGLLFTIALGTLSLAVSVFYQSN